MIAVFVGAAAQAANYNIEFCIVTATNFTDVDGGDYWTSNTPNRELPGVWMRIERKLTSVLAWEGFTDDTNGCQTVTLSDAYDYKIEVKSMAVTNGIDINVYDDVATPALTTWILRGTGVGFFEPELSDGTEVLVVGASTTSGVLAVATNMVEPTNWGLPSGTNLDYHLDGCCSGGSSIKVASTSKTTISHETTHGILFRRDNNENPNHSYLASEDGCDGDNVDLDKHAQVSKEFSAGAAIEGMADTGSTWMWNNNTTESDCELNRAYASDFDLDGVVDNAPAAGKLNCEGAPTTGLASYVDARDWLSDVVNADDDNADGIQCTGTLVSRSSQLDWLRYGWDMLTDEALSIKDLADIYDLANPRSWDPDDFDLTFDDDVRVRWEAAADAAGFGAAHDDQKDNGQDH